MIEGAGCACSGACRVTGVCPVHGGVMFTPESLAEERARETATLVEQFFATRTIGNSRSMLRFTEAELLELTVSLVAAHCPH